MKRPILKNYLDDFLSKHKENKYLVSKDEIVKLRKRNKLQYYFVDVFGSQSEYSDPSNQQMLNHYMDDIEFGFKFSSPKSTVSQDTNNKLLIVNSPIIF